MWRTILFRFDNLIVRCNLYTLTLEWSPAEQEVLWKLRVGDR